MADARASEAPVPGKAKQAGGEAAREAVQDPKTRAPKKKKSRIAPGVEGSHPYKQNLGDLADNAKKKAAARDKAEKVVKAKRLQMHRLLAAEMNGYIPSRQNSSKHPELREDSSDEELRSDPLRNIPSRELSEVQRMQRRMQEMQVVLKREREEKTQLQTAAEAFKERMRVLEVAAAKAAVATIAAPSPRPPFPPHGSMSNSPKPLSKMLPPLQTPSPASSSPSAAEAIPIPPTNPPPWGGSNPRPPVAGGPRPIVRASKAVAKAKPKGPKDEKEKQKEEEEEKALEKRIRELEVEMSGLDKEAGVLKAQLSHCNAKILKRRAEDSESSSRASTAGGPPCDDMSPRDLAGEVLSAFTWEGGVRAPKKVWEEPGRPRAETPGTPPEESPSPSKKPKKDSPQEDAWLAVVLARGPGALEREKAMFKVARQNRDMQKKVGARLHALSDKHAMELGDAEDKLLREKQRLLDKWTDTETAKVIMHEKLVQEQDLLRGEQRRCRRLKREARETGTLLEDARRRRELGQGKLDRDRERAALRVAAVAVEVLAAADGTTAATWDLAGAGEETEGAKRSREVLAERGRVLDAWEAAEQAAAEQLRGGSIPVGAKQALASEKRALKAEEKANEPGRAHVLAERRRILAMWEEAERAKERWGDVGKSFGGGARIARAARIRAKNNLKKQREVLAQLGSAADMSKPSGQQGVARSKSGEKNGEKQDLTAENRRILALWEEAQSAKANLHARQKKQARGGSDDMESVGDALTLDEVQEGEELVANARVIIFK
eukprot:gene6146-7371_t